MLVDHFFDGNKARFAKTIGEAPTSVSNLLTGRRSVPSARTLKRICETIDDLSPGWLLTGRGEMICPPAVAAAGGRPYYDVDFKGGFDLLVNDQTDRPDAYISLPPFNLDGVCWCNLTGHSMEPEIGNGDLIALREVPDWDRFLVFGETYALVTRNELRTVKRVRRGSAPDRFLLVPANPAYEPQEVEKRLVMRVFKVLGCVRRF